MNRCVIFSLLEKKTKGTKLIKTDQTKKTTGNKKPKEDNKQ